MTNTRSLQPKLNPCAQNLEATYTNLQKKSNLKFFYETLLVHGNQLLAYLCVTMLTKFPVLGIILSH